MKQISTQTFKYWILLLSGLCAHTVYANTAFNPHNLETVEAQTSSQCLACHKTVPDKADEINSRHITPRMNDYIKSATGMCTDCHGEDSSSHIVGVTPDYTVPADLPLNQNQQVTCLTCHYTHGSLSSDIPVASISFMDRLFSRERLTKSYILRRNNADGDLCLACHSQ